MQKRNIWQKGETAHVKDISNSLIYFSLNFIEVRTGNRIFPVLIFLFAKTKKAAFGAVVSVGSTVVSTVVVVEGVVVVVVEVLVLALQPATEVKIVLAVMNVANFFLNSIFLFIFNHLLY